MLRWKWLVFVLCCALVAPLAGCTTTDPAADDPVVFRWARMEGPTSLDPAVLYGNRSIELAQNLFDGLTDLDHDMNIIPSIAERWEVSEDGLTYTFFLREDVYFSNGDQVTAEDFKFSWNRALWPETGNRHLFMMGLIKGAGDVISGDKQEAEGIVVKDKFVFEVTLEFPASYFLSLTTRWPYWVVHPETVNTHGEDWIQPENFVSTGAFLLEEAELEERYVFVANDNHFRGRPAIDRVEIEIIPEGIMRMMRYEADEIDAFDSLVPADLRRVQADDTLKNELHTKAMMRTLWLAMNALKPPFDNVKLRQAFQYAIDKEALIETALEGMGAPAHTFLPPGMPSMDPSYQPYEFNPERGRQLLEEAGYPGGEGLPPLDIAFPASDDNQKIFEFVQAEFKDNLGIHVELRSLPPSAFLEVRNDDEQRPYFFRNGMGADYPDPQEFLEYFGLTVTFHNFEGHRNEQFDELVLEANRHHDYEERMRLYDQAHRLYMEASVMVPLTHPLTTYMVKPTFVGFEYTPLYPVQLRFVEPAK